MKRSIRTAAVMALASLLALAACGGGDQGSGAATDPANDAAGGAEGSTTDGSAEGDLDLDADVVFAYPVTVSRLDPHLASISQDGTTLFPAYDRLIHPLPNGELVPGLAESWSFNDDATELTLTIREGVVFHDGAGLDAQAVKASLDRALTLEGSVAATDLTSLESVEVIDPTTVVLHLARPDTTIVGPLSDRAGVIISPEAIATGVDLDQQMVGAGPFRMVEHVSGSTTRFERFDDYWDQDNEAKVQGLEIQVLADSQTRTNGLLTGQVDVTVVDPNNLAEIETDPNLDVQAATGIAYYFIAQNRAQAGQDDVRVRRAMLHALDREGLCQALFLGYCEITDQPVPPGHPAFNTDIDQVLYPYDPERARELLAEAGIEGLELTFIIPGGLPPYPAIAEAVQAQWGEVGIATSIEQVDPPQIGRIFFVDQRGEVMLAQRGGRPDPAMNWSQRTLPDAFANPGGHTTDRMMELLDTINASVDPDDRTAALQLGSREVAESVLEMPLMFPQTPVVTADGVSFTPYASSIHEFRDISVSTGA